VVVAASFLAYASSLRNAFLWDDLYLAAVIPPGDVGQRAGCAAHHAPPRRLTVGGDAATLEREGGPG
jgi:hypothetical protein